MALSKRELIEALAPFPDEALIDVEVGYDSSSYPDIVGVGGFDERFGYITLKAYVL